MRPLKDELPPVGDKVLYVFYDFETSQNTEYANKAKLHETNLVCVQQFCSRCEDAEDARDCVRCGTERLSIWQDPVGELFSYLTEPPPWAIKIIAIARNAKAFDLHFILNKAILLKRKPDLIMNRLIIMCMRMEQLVFLDSVSFLPFPLRRLTEAFGLTVANSWYSYYFNTEENLDYI